jgi:hypothetical protein
VNEGTKQPKFDARVDYDLANDGGSVTFEGGVAGTQGLIYSGIGPFNISSDSRMSYFTTRYQKGGRRVAFFTNLLNGNASNLLSFGINGRPLPLDFDTKTFDVEANDVKAIGTTHVLSYGGNFRRNTFDISLAPNGDNRSEGGGYLQDEIFLNNYFRWVVGAAFDKFSSIEDARVLTAHDLPHEAERRQHVPGVRQPRIPGAVVHQQPHPDGDPQPGGFAGAGAASVALAVHLSDHRRRQPDLKPETMTAFEIGYTGVVATARA